MNERNGIRTIVGICFLSCSFFILLGGYSQYLRINDISAYRKTPSLIQSIGLSSSWYSYIPKGLFALFISCSVLCFVLLAISIFAKKRALFFAGCITGIVVRLYAFYPLLKNRENLDALFPISIALDLCFLFVLVFLFFAAINRRGAIWWCILSALASLGAFVFSKIGYSTARKQYRFLFHIYLPGTVASILFSLLLFIAVILSGIVFSTRISKTQKGISSSISENDTISIDKLVKLKSLLDRGIITQEEYNVKKKEIIG